MSAQHTPARWCDACEGFCLRSATIDEANTALATAMTRGSRLRACEVLAAAAERMAQTLRTSAPTRAPVRTPSET